MYSNSELIDLAFAALLNGTITFAEYVEVYL